MGSPLSRRIKAVALALGIVGVMSLASDEPRYHPAAVTDADMARAGSYLDEYLAPLPDWTWGEVRFRGGTIRTGSTSNTDAAVTVLVIPGYTGSIEYYTTFINALHDRGHRVMAMDLPGQGQSSRRADNPEKPWTGNFRLYGDLTAKVVEAIRPEVSGNLIVLGDSFGGHSILRAAHDHALPVEGIITTVPALDLYTPGFPEYFAKGWTDAMTWMGLGHTFAPLQSNWSFRWDVNPEEFKCGTRPDRANLHAALNAHRPELRVSGVTNEWVTGLERSGKYLAKNGAIAEPTSVIVGDLDSVVRNDRAIALCEDNAPHCKVFHLETAEHCMQLEPDENFDQLMSIIDSEIRRFTSLP